MQLTALLDALGYTDSPNFLRTGTKGFQCAPDYGHIFRRAGHKKSCGLHGVYTLRASLPRAAEAIVPVVYVCDAKDEAEADAIHRLVWNQNVVPFLVVNTRGAIRLYSGFHFRQSSAGADLGILREFNEVLDLADAFRADAIDDGRLWRKWGDKVTPEDRVDWRLLGNLRRLDDWLQHTGNLDRDVSHALIGKYVYLHYLRDRDILSDRKLEGWGIEATTVFGSSATPAGLRAVIERLDEWLNGSVFPIPRKGALKQEHVRRVAGTFKGDEIDGDSTWQLHLDFRAYDFSYIPIETLSVVYEQFLHAPDTKGESKGKEASAYYTPIPVVNYMLTELENRRPLQEGTRICDPSCGSGAFLVQSYRRLIEKTFPATKRVAPRPVQLRDLLQKHIFGVDRDDDACSVTELSLVLTLLDYVDPPDLENTKFNKDFKLPALRDQNVFCADFFDRDAAWCKLLEAKKCDWIVGNPPWKKLDPNGLRPPDRPAWDWMKGNKQERPVGGNELAQAFAWEVARYSASDGEIAMLLPAMGLFESRSVAFRMAFFRQMQVGAVANFANLAEVLFAGRSRVPAAAIFYRPREVASLNGGEDEAIDAFSPLVANQEPTRPDSAGKRNETWGLVLNASEMRHIPLGQVVNGSGLPWKIAMWGSHLDRRLLHRVTRRFSSFRELEHDKVLVISEGPQLRPTSVPKEPERTEYLSEVADKLVLDVKELAEQRHLFVLPDQSLKPNKKFHVRVHGGKRGVSVCRPPHVIVSAARNFAVYTDEYLIVPPRQIGIASPSGDEAFLKALCLYLNSDFAFYHQFFTSTQFGVQRGLATLDALRQMPVPIPSAGERDFDRWVELYSRLLRASQEEAIAIEAAKTPLLDAPVKIESLDDLLGELNEMVDDCLGLDGRERALVHDLVHVRLELNDGKVGEPAIRAPRPSEFRAYAKRLKSELDAFIGNDLPKRYEVGVVFDDLSGMVQVDLTKDIEAARKIAVLQADEAGAAELEKTRRRLRTRRGQWLYFDRNLRIYQGTRTFVFKPMQRFHWTESQAMFDAAEIIAETLAGSGE